MSATVTASAEELRDELKTLTRRVDELVEENDGLKKQLSGVADANVLAAQLMTQLEDAQQELEKEKLELRAAKDSAEEMAEVIRENASRLQAIVNNALEGIVTCRDDGSIVFFSPRATEMFGYDSDEVVQNTLLDLLGPCRNEGDHGLRSFFDDLDAAERVTGETLGVRKDGQTIPIHISLCRIDTEEERFVTAIIRDLTEEKRIQSRLVQSEKLQSIGRLAAGIAHEINTPIQYVGDNADFLKGAFADVTDLLESLVEFLESAKSGSCPADRIEQAERDVDSADLEFLQTEIPTAIEQALQGIARVSEIVKAMKSFSHPGSEQKQLADLNAAIDSTLTVSRNEWKYVAEADLDLDPDLPSVPVHIAEFNQVVLNMIVNAAHAIEATKGVRGEDPGRITISSRQVDGDAEIRIADNGTGIPEDVCARVFDPFFTTKEVGKGTGQGLAIARSIVVDKHGGTIDVDSAVGEGTTFILRLPLADPDAAEPDAGV